MCACQPPDMICQLWFLHTQDALNEAKCDFYVAGFLRVIGVFFLFVALAHQRDFCPTPINGFNTSGQNVLLHLRWSFS